MNVQGPDGKVIAFPDSMSTDDVNKAMLSIYKPEDPTGPKAFEANRTGSFLDNTIAGIGQGMTDIGQGSLQLAEHLGNPIWYLPRASEEQKKSLDEEINRKIGTDKALLNTGGGKVGAMIGQTAATFPLARASLGISPIAPGALGSIATQGINSGMKGGVLAALQPTETHGDDYAQQKLEQTALGLATGAGVGVGLGTLSQGAKKLATPVASLFNALGGKSAATPFAQEGEDLAQRTGIELTPGQITGSKTQTSMENLARQSIFSRQQAFEADQKIVQQWTDYVQNTIDGITSGGGSPGEIGTRVQGAVKNAVDRLQSIRDGAANKDYGDIRTLLAQQKAGIVPQNYMSKLQELAQEFSGAPEGSDYAKLTKTLGSLQENGLQNADLGVLMKTRRFLSQVAGGQVNLAGDTGKGLQRSVATQLLGAIDDDLDASAQKVGGPVGKMLQDANARYRGFSQQIEGLKNSALGKLVGQDFTEAVGSGQFNQIPGETVMQRLQTLKPSQLTSAKSILNDPTIGDPDAWNQIKKGVLQTALERAQQAAPSEGANALAARPNVFVSALAKTPEDQAKLSILFEPKEQAQIADALAAARRISDKTGINFSGTAQAAEGYGVAHAIGSALTGNFKPLAGLAGGAISGRSIANIMMNSQGRAMVQELDRLPPGSQRFTELAAKLSAIAAADSVNSGTQQGQ